MNIIWPIELDFNYVELLKSSSKRFNFVCSDCGKQSSVRVDGNNLRLCQLACDKEDRVSYFCQDCFELRGYGIGSCHSNNRFINMVKSA